MSSCVAVLAFGATAAGAATPPPGFFGVGGWSYPTTGQSAQLGSDGLGIVRAALGWGTIQPTANPASRNWGDADRVAKEAASGGYNLIFVLNGCAVWACGTVLAPPTGAELDNYRRFVAAAVTRYEPSSPFWAGQTRIPTITWQVWNEVNAGYFWPNPTPASYATFLGEITQTIRAVDPSAPVIMSALTALPGDSGNGIQLAPFLAGLYQQPGFTADTDAVAVNAYADTPADSVHVLDEAREVMLANHDAARPIWVTEMGWASGGPASALTVTPEQQRDYLVSAWDTMLACRARWNLQHVLWFALQDPRPSLFETADYWGFHNGLLNVDGSAKPSYFSFLQFIGAAPLPDGGGDSCPLPGGTSLDGTKPVDTPAPSATNATIGAVTPATTIVSFHRLAHQRQRVVLAFSATESGEPLAAAHYQCRIDLRQWRTCRSPYASRRLRAGRHTIEVRAIDSAGDVDPYPAFVRFTVTTPR